ncbi:MAG TPA: aldolase/citrate lyase family protein [Aestuariivirga sp.]|nr:aldolase/citrate lyase family protein [Aestuariivirga sp.]
MATQSFDLKARLANRREPFLFSWMTIPSPQLAGQLARLPIEGVCLDMQHGTIGFSDAAPMIAAISSAGRPAIARILWNEPGLIGQVLDAGAAAVIVPMVNSKEQAEAAVKAAKYPPLGGRSWGGYTAFQTYGLSPADYLRKANSITQVFAMIETQAALDAVEEIAAVPGLDGLFVGPSDLSIALSKGAGIDKTAKHTLDAMKLIAAAAAKNNLVAGAFAGSADVINTYAAMGYTFMAGAVDVDLLQAGAESLIKAVKGV